MLVVCGSAVFCEFWPATRSADGSDNHAQQSSRASADVTNGSISELEALVCHPNDAVIAYYSSTNSFDQSTVPTQA